MSDCIVCGGLLTGRQKKYDSAECQKKAGREAWILKTYGISLQQYDQILAYQSGRCGCCRRPFKAGQTPHIDHEHGGGVRGIVHAYCNTRLIGRLKDPTLAQNLADYLTNPPARAVLGEGQIAPGRPRKRRQPRRRPRAER